jgi:enamine deaminase RidA (YjgF/YER057c/UK114 family)
MTLECINPEDLPTPLTYTQVVVATGSRLVFVAGQEPEDEHGNLVGPGDLAVQARQVFANLGRALAAADARPDQVTKITIFVVGYRRDECLPTIEEGRVALFGDHKPADTLVGSGGAVPRLPDRGRGDRRCRWLTRISAPVFRPLGQANSKWSWRPPHQGTAVSAGRSASRRTGE